MKPNCCNPIIIEHYCIMKFSVDSQQRLTAAAIMLLEFYKVTMGTFLVVFVPQQCGEDVCSLSDNFFNDAPLNRAALACNFAAFAAILGFYGIEIKRENWCIKYLDIDPNRSNNHLDDEIEGYPVLKSDMASLNNQYLCALYAAATLLAANFGVSGTAIALNYAGSNTLTSLLSFVLLVSMKLYAAHSVGTRSVEEERAFSGYLTIARTYNTIDEDHRTDGANIENQDSIAHTDAADITYGATSIVGELSNRA